MDFYQTCKKYLENDGYSYLGEDGGLVFFKDVNGKVWGASEEAIVKKMTEKGYW